MKKVIKRIRTLVHCIKCPSCRDIIYSRTRHDFHFCTCGSIAIDGGFDYLRVMYNKKYPKNLKKYVSATKEELFQDWNRGENKFGWVKEKK